MKRKTIKILLLIVQYLLLFAALAFMLFWLYEELSGPQSTAQLLEALHIPISTGWMTIIGFVCIAAFIVLQIVYNKNFKDQS